MLIIDDWYCIYVSVGLVGLFVSLDLRITLKAYDDILLKKRFDDMWVR